MDWKALYEQHVTSVMADVEKALNGEPFEGIVFHSGSQHHYHADDREIPFVTVPHFARIVPAGGADHLLVVRPGHKPRLVRNVPRDYWYEPPVQPDHPYPQILDCVEVDGREAATAAAGDVSKLAYVGDDPKFAKALGIAAAAQQPARLLARLDWQRAYKTPYEIECLREAGRRASVGHAAVRAGMQQGWSERKLHAAYLEAVGTMENHAPYTNIIGWDEHAAVLHYQSKDLDDPKGKRCFLIDAGATHLGYASDVTRTYATAKAHPVFVDMLDKMDSLQRQLVAKVKPNQGFVDLHDQAHRGVAAILSETGVSRGSAEQTYEEGLTHPFLPHGLGHHLGIQVHDVGGHQQGFEGGKVTPPDQYPFLRTTRVLESNNVVTIEPGLYFIPMLLQKHREGPKAARIDWDLVDALTPCGGIRIEDNIVVTETGQEDLTRPFIPGHNGGA